ncbi:MAG: hypothetical protein ABL912_05765 [Novosphingobium sp.]
MRRTVRTMAAILAVTAPAFTAPALAETMPKFYVYGEDDGTTSLTKCKVSHASAITAVQSELKAKGIAIQYDSKDPQAVMDTYLNLTAMEIPGGKGDCTYHFDLSLESFGDTANPFTGANEFTKLTYCSKGSLMVWDTKTAQATINETLREYVGVCLTRYQRRNDKK